MGRRLEKREMTYPEALTALENEVPPPPAWHTLWTVYKGARVGVEFEVFEKRGSLFITRPVALRVGPEGPRFPFAEDCPPGILDLSQGLKDDAIPELLPIAGFSAHERLKIEAACLKQAERET